MFFNMPTKHLKWLSVTATAAFAFLAFYLAYNHVFPGLVNIFWQGLGMLLPFIIAIILTALLEPLIDFTVKKTRIPRGLVVLITLTVLLAFLFVVIFFFAGHLISELMRLANFLPGIANDLVKNAEYWLINLAALSETVQLPAQTLAAIENIVYEMADSVQDYTVQGANWMVAVLAGLPLTFFKVIITFIAAFFFMRDGRKFVDLMYAHLPRNWATSIDHVGSNLGASVVRFIRAISILITITFIITWIGLTLMDMEFAFTIAVITGMLDILPILGPGLIFIPWSIISFIMGDIALGFYLLLLYAVVVVFRTILEPKVIGDSIGLHPLETLIAIFVGLTTIGPAGVIILPLFLITIKAIYKEKMMQKEA